MLSRTGIATVSVVLWSAAGVHVAGSTPKPTVPEVVGATEVQKLTAPTGFIDDAIAFDDTRFAYVVADGSEKTELHVLGPASATNPAKTGSGSGSSGETLVDLSPITLHPLTLRLLGPRVFVTGIDANNAQVAALVELSTGKPIYKLGPATNITVITRDGKPRVAVHRLTGTRHEVELDAIETGKRVAAGHAIELDATDKSKALDLHVNHWSDGWTKAYGIKGGEWDRKENQRSPDVEATYDLIAGKLIDSHPITDLFEQRKRFQVLEQAKADANLDFVRMSWDNANVVAWREGKAQNLELDQALGQYDPKSLQGVLEADGTTWIALKVDPVNPDAVARKKADAEYVDIFKAGSDGKAVRKARVLATGTKVKLGVVSKSGEGPARSSAEDGAKVDSKSGEGPARSSAEGGAKVISKSGEGPARSSTEGGAKVDIKSGGGPARSSAEGGAKVNAKIWLLERSPGFDRGGKSLTIYTLN